MHVNLSDLRYYKYCTFLRRKLHCSLLFGGCECEHEFDAVFSLAGEDAGARSRLDQTTSTNELLRLTTGVYKTMSLYLACELIGI